MTKLQEFQKIIGYQFHTEGLLRQALTHSSYANEKKMKKHSDNERLEFLGDAVLEVVSSDFLYHRYPDWSEGELTKCRASIVSEQPLAFCSRKIDLGRFLYLGKGEDQTGGRRRDSILSDAFEAVIGAVYLDGGLEAARQHIVHFVMDDMDNIQLFHDSKTILQEMVQAHEWGDLSYHLISEDGPDHAKRYTIEARIGDRSYGTGEGHTKKSAEQHAAYQAILALKDPSHENQ